MTKALTIQEIAALIRPGMRVLLHAGPVECLALQEALRADPERAAGVIFTGLFIPGVNTFDYAALTPTTRVQSTFVPPTSRATFEGGRLEFLPLHYSAFAAYLARHPADLAILHLPPPRDGVFSCGLGADVADGVSRYARRVVVIVNPSLPHTRGAIAIDADEVEAVAETDEPVTVFAESGGEPVVTAMAARVAAFVEDGDTLQIGIGRLPCAVLRALRGRRRLRFHTGIINDEVLRLVDEGAIAEPDGEHAPIITGIALGGSDVLAVSARPEVAFHGVAVTHDARRIAQIPRFTAINSAVEVDLFGNVNCETVRGRQVSGIGGAADFARAARLAEDGRAIVALPSQAGGKSRIVPCLAGGSTSQTRNDIDILVTEHGSVRLRDLGLDARAEAISMLAAPEDRPGLADAWRALRAKL